MELKQFMKQMELIERLDSPKNTSQLAKELNLSRRTIKEKLKPLTQKGIVTKRYVPKSSELSRLKERIERIKLRKEDCPKGYPKKFKIKKKRMAITRATPREYSLSKENRSLSLHEDAKKVMDKFRKAQAQLKKKGVNFRI